MVPTHPALYRHQPSHIKSTRFAPRTGSKYIPNAYVRTDMKVQKIVSLDLETAELAARMTNFSAFVRRSLRAEAVGADVASEMALRARWAQCAHRLAELAFDYAKYRAKEMDVEMKYETWQELEYDVFHQTSLEDFE